MDNKNLEKITKILGLTTAVIGLASALRYALSIDDGISTSIKKQYCKITGKQYKETEAVKNDDLKSLKEELDKVYIKCEICGKTNLRVTSISPREYIKGTDSAPREVAMFWSADCGSCGARSVITEHWLGYSESLLNMARYFAEYAENVEQSILSSVTENQDENKSEE